MGQKQSKRKKNKSMQSGECYIFCYGSNGPRQLSERVKTDYDEMMAKTMPCELIGWKRGFKGLAMTWGGSTATLYKTDDPNDVVVGTAVKMTTAEVAALDPFEAAPFKYERRFVKVTAYNLN